MDGVEGSVFAGYRIERRLGVGGVGAVFLVQHPRLPRKDALKILSDTHQGDEEFRARFLREAEVAARLQHPNLVAVWDRGEYQGRLWIAMQYIDGGDVAELLRGGPLGVSRAVHILTEAARGLDEIHRAGLLHRDVKPANILVAGQPGQPDRVLLTDFGIARDADDATTLGGPGVVTATLAYAAPEQIGGEAVDRRTDVYALGGTLYHLLTGSVPFPRESAGSVMYAHLHEPPPAPSRVNPGVPRGFDAVIATAMAKDPAQRYPSGAALAAAAHAAMAASDFVGTEVISVRPSGRRRRGLLVGGALLAVLLVAAVTVALIAGSGRDTPAATTAQPKPPAVNTGAWGAYAYIAQTFPKLLPPVPFSIGYQDLTGCAPDDRGKDQSYDTSAPVSKLFCVGNLDPAQTVLIACNVNRSPIVPERPPRTVEGEQRWSGPSGSGRLNWGSDTGVDGKPAGVLEVYFDDPGKNFCRIRVDGPGSGVDLRDMWWMNAPL
ncbi:serine/threonine-protein kinase [Nocardia sp. NPDC052566]|uniref:serine/threonine-protein kinase n=1 Tax=Nocardia sp. NPDC052566 TaxID=3364330 RepID=UPI0037CCC025